MNMGDKTLYINLLVILQNFENFWNMYSISEGLLYRKQTKEAAKNFIELFKIVADKDPKIRNSKELHINGKNSTEYIDDLNQAIAEWIESDKKFPIESTELGIGDNEKTRFHFQGYLMCLSAYLLNKIELDYYPIICKTSGEGAFHYNNVKWEDRFPWQICDQVDKSLLFSLSESETVVVIGDIRKSQDLITYATNPETYRTNMAFLIDRVRKTVLENMGIFDRFTGDGFICYFNDSLLQKFHKDLYETVIDVCVKIQKECKPLFEDWQHGLRKLSQESIGLSIGVDSGVMNFSDDRMMFAIGNPAVWATRMCATGNAGDIILNNIPHSKICCSDLSFNFDEVFGTTKTGEKFKAFKLKYK